MRVLKFFFLLLLFGLVNAQGTWLDSWEDTFTNDLYVSSSTNIEISGGTAHLKTLSSTQFVGGSLVTVKTEKDKWNYTAKIRVPVNFLASKLELNLTGEVMETSERKPLDVVLVTDISGSMSGSKLARAKEADKKFVNIVLPDNTGNTSVGLVKYSTNGHRDTCLLNDNETLIDAIDNYTSGGSTCIACGMKIAISLLEASQKQNKVILLMTDGLANQYNTTTSKDFTCGFTSLYKINGVSGDNEPEEEANKSAVEAGNKGIKVYAIGFGYNADEDLLRNMSYYGGGKYYFAPTGDELKEIYEEIAIEVSRYYPENITIDVGGTGNTLTQWHYGNELKSELVDLTSQLNNLVALYPNCNCPNCSIFGDECEITIAIKSETGGTLIFKDLELTGRVSSGSLLSTEVDPPDPFGGWYEICYEAGNISSSTNLMIYIVNSSGNDIPCAHCTLVGENGTHCYDLVGDIDTSIKPLYLKAVFDTNDPKVSPELSYWNISWIAATPPDAEPDGPYTCITGESKTLNGSSTTDAVYCPTGGDGCTDLTYEWKITGINSIWSDMFTGVKPTITCPPVGEYKVTLNVTNKNGLSDVDFTYLYSNPTNANLTVEDIYISEPSISEIKSEIVVTVKNVGMSKSANYNLSFKIFDKDGNVVYSENITQPSLPGEKKRKDGFVWVPRKPGKYTLQIAIVNETGNSIYTTGDTIYVQKQESTSLIAPEYPSISVLLVPLLVSLFAYLISSRKK